MIALKSKYDPMRWAIEQALEAKNTDEVPVGAVIVDNTGHILAKANNQTRQNHDPTAHAEIIALRQATQKVKNHILPQCELYVTLEPCPMCASALSFAHIKRIYFGAYDTKRGGIDHGVRLYENTPALHRPEVYGGIHQTECENILKNFFQKKRQ